jgi:transposase
MWLREPKKILAYGTPIDMRKSFDGLLGVIKGEMLEDPISETVFLFVNRRGNYLKGIYWDRTGYFLFAKRLERGKFKFPNDERKQEITEQILKLILDGIQLGRRTRMS